MRRATRVLLVLGVLLAAGAGTAALLWQRGEIAVRAVTLKRGDMVISVSATATGTVESEAEVNLRAEVPGRILRLLVDEGDRVTRGQIVAELDPQEVEAQLGLARADLATARARLEEEQAGIIMLRERVRTRIDETRATRERAARDLERLTALLAEGAISRQQLDQAQAEFEVAAAAHEAALADRDQIAVKEHQVAAAAAAVAQREAQVRLVDVQRSRMTIRSPSAGLVTRRLANEGEVVGLGGGSTITLGGPLFTLVDLDRLYVRATIDEFDARQIRLDQEARVSLEALPGRTLRGRVYKISPAVSGERQEARTFNIRVALEEGKGFVKPGMSADVEVIVARRQNALFVPSQSILEREGKRWVHRIADGRARLVAVKVGENNWQSTEILEGLGEGDQIIVNPDVPGLSDGARVRVH
jgi:HlyD family secretion protein